jgi:hypothetical protein
MTVHAVRLMKALAAGATTRTDAIGMTPADVTAAIAELEGLYDDDGKPLGVLKSWHAGGRIVALELTPQGQQLARALT